MASKLLIPILLGAICILTVVTAEENGNFKDSHVISMPTATDEKNLVFAMQWGYSYCCPKTSDSCCIAPYVGPDFVMHTIWTITRKGDYETNCNGPLFDENEVSAEDLAYMQVYWPTSECGSSSVGYWKSMWEIFGRCSGLSQEAWFKLNVQIFQPNFTVGLKSQGIIPGGKYNVDRYKKGLEAAVGHKVGLTCNNNSATGEAQLYEVLICYSPDKNEVVDCDSHNLPSTPRPGNIECTGSIPLPRKPCKPSSGSCHSDE